MTSAGCTIRGLGVQQVPKEASLWAMSRQDLQRQCSVPTLQQRHVARKAARSAAAPAQDLQPLHLCGLEVSANSTSAPEQFFLAAEPSAIRELSEDEQLPSSDPAGRCPLQGSGSGSARSSAMPKETVPCLKQAGVAQGKANSNKALRVQSLRQELVAAEAVVEELKSWLADAEAELEEERANGR